MYVKFAHSEGIAQNILTFWFEPEKKPDYIAGQFIEMFLPHPNPDERGIKHWFTLSSSPTEPLISITTKFTPGRSSTFKQTLRALKPGDSIRIIEPMGDFVLPKHKATPLLFVAGGIGVTPMRSMVKWLQDTGERRNITLLYAASSADEFVFTDLFKSYGVKLTQIIKDPGPDWTGEKGILSPERILAEARPESLIYVSGPEPMTEALVDGLKEKGVKEHRLVTDYFPGYLPI
jgi:glycine betaine catabolism B